MIINLDEYRRRLNKPATKLERLKRIERMQLSLCKIEDMSKEDTGGEDSE
jgi:hypothetical protein